MMDATDGGDVMLLLLMIMLLLAAGITGERGPAHQLRWVAASLHPHPEERVEELREDEEEQTLAFALERACWEQ